MNNALQEGLTIGKIPYVNWPILLFLFLCVLGILAEATTWNLL